MVRLIVVLKLYSEEGKRIYALSRDHKPCDELEKRRIIEAGGQIYQ
jgi:serine/threonine protein phosphatase PrpC